MNTINCINSYPTSFQGKLEVIGKNCNMLEGQYKLTKLVLEQNLLNNPNVINYLQKTPDSTVLKAIYEPHAKKSRHNSNIPGIYITKLSIQFYDGLVHEIINPFCDNVQRTIASIKELGDLFKIHDTLISANKAATDPSINNFVKTKIN